jgi:hypothetical protein
MVLLWPISSALEGAGSTLALVDSKFSEVKAALATRPKIDVRNARLCMRFPPGSELYVSNVQSRMTFLRLNLPVENAAG